MARDKHGDWRNRAPVAPPPPVREPDAAPVVSEAPAPEPEEMVRVEGAAPSLEDLAADRAALISQVAELRARVDELSAQLDAERALHGGSLRAMRAAFEADLAALSPERIIPAPEASIAPRRPRAVGSLRCHLHGAPLTVADGQEIPEGVDLSTLPPHAFVEG